MDEREKSEIIETDVVIVGGGPAGMVLGMMLAQAEVNVTVVESQANFDREYRGEVLQPRFLQLMEKLGMRSYIESLPHAQVRAGTFFKKGRKLGEFAFHRFIPEIPYAIWTPQPILLQAYYDYMKDSSYFHMKFHASVKELLRENGRVTGVVIETEHKERTEIRAKITVGADGRFSTIRRLGGFQLEYEDYPGDIIWFNIDQPENPQDVLQFHMTDKYPYLTLPKYPNLLQVGIVLGSGRWKQVQREGIESFKADLAEMSSAFHPFLQTVTSFRSFFPLQAKTQYVKEWAQDGCLLIGDAAHCSSPAGAIGVSLAVTTSAIAAEAIYDSLKKNDVSASSLRRVQQIRDSEIRMIHQIQMRMGRMLFNRHPILNALRPYLLALFTRTPIATTVLKKMMTLPKDIHINERFRFKNKE
ncbi:2-polyprenyl-6-methoxyphenol hydroxylase-like FAD-dependent oxidoreductase [Croceifilum oryzae]|uniref:2-polyprenyl-6-methoxyphenol hydroxylase-like FAD-dependent oxidoreductase n=1 Tax=Croceifilum oryzae TaxID=1553429 RepID=A0AAJ1THN3_9BACL|nr:FAD-dependent monooxygenase [Croceifilum oryzae]MDQ0417172.1 2-polyprenyl-6-methoxyphenol hydroxylase-like FAD-dependent oxidoreductase [Croceifilum oryzae]